MMNTQVAHHHASQPLKYQEEPGSRTTSPTVPLHSAHPDCTGSPLATSHSTLSTSSPLSLDHYLYSRQGQQHQNNQYVGHPTAVGLTRSPMASDTASGPVPVRSASWVAGSQEPNPASVPAIIMTQSEGSQDSFLATIPSSKLQQKSSSKPVSAVKKKQNTKKCEKTAGGGKNGEAVNARRQKRLERNRESARLSRRRRKQYLEVLEDRVTQLSLEMDQGRRAHAAAAIETVLAKRRELLNSAHPIDPNNALPTLDTSLSRTSQELSVLSTFQMQQLKSFALPAHSKFVLWLTLQNDGYFRGGRAASERLSAARIGERMLQSGNDRVTPANSMWPLFCNEVGLSYDQEERVRNFQRTLLQDSPTWLERHTARASSLVMQSFHDGTNAVGSRLHQRERTSTARLSPAQRMKFLAWAESNAGRIQEKFRDKRRSLGKEKESDEFNTSSAHHLAANLYILNNRLQKVLAQLPPHAELVDAAHRKRLSRRPSFESLGQQKDENGSPMTRENSFASSGSLKRSVSSLSMVSENGEEKAPQQVSPEDGERTAVPLIDKELGFIKKIIPPITQPEFPPAPAPVSVPPMPQAYHAHHYAPQAHFSHPGMPPSAPYTMVAQHHQPQMTHHSNVIHHAPSPHAQPLQHHVAPPQAHAPTPTTQTTYQPYFGNQMAQPQPVYPQPAPASVHHQPHLVYGAPPSHASPTPVPASASAETSQHARKSSFLPPHLNVVPEEMFPSTDGTEDFLMSLIDDGDWAIGEGVDMDTTA